MAVVATAARPVVIRLNVVTQGAIAAAAAVVDFPSRWISTSSCQDCAVVAVVATRAAVIPAVIPVEADVDCSITTVDAVIQAAAIPAEADVVCSTAIGAAVIPAVAILAAIRAAIRAAVVAAVDVDCSIATVAAVTLVAAVIPAVTLVAVAIPAATLVAIHPAVDPVDSSDEIAAADQPGVGCSASVGGETAVTPVVATQAADTVHWFPTAAAATVAAVIREAAVPSPLRQLR